MVNILLIISLFVLFKLSLLSFIDLFENKESRKIGIIFDFFGLLIGFVFVLIMFLFGISRLFE